MIDSNLLEVIPRSVSTKKNLPFITQMNNKPIYESERVKNFKAKFKDINFGTLK